MQVLKVYEYPNCSTCKKALKFLLNHHFATERVNIFEKPPTISELKKMLEFQGGDIRKLFNTSGKVYQDLNLKEKLRSMPEADALNLLASNGRLVKRPFVLMEKTGLIGFDPKAWKALFG